MNTRQLIIPFVALWLGVALGCQREPARTAEQLHWDSVAAGPRWVLAHSDTRYSAFFDRESMVRVDSLEFRAWWKVRDSSGALARVMWLSEFSCGVRGWRDLRVVEVDSAGIEQVNETSEGRFVDVRPQSGGESILRSVCGYAGSRNLPIVTP